MPSILRSRLALFGLLGAFLIPIGMSSLRGLTHILVCRKAAEQPFTMIIPPEGEPEILSSTRIRAGATEDKICGGLTIQPRASTEGEGRIAFELPIKNTSEFAWRGTVSLKLEGTQIPVDIGEIPSGETRSDTIHLTLEEGQHELTGSLLIGP